MSWTPSNLTLKTYGKRDIAPPLHLLSRIGVILLKLLPKKKTTLKWDVQANVANLASDINSDLILKILKKYSWKYLINSLALTREQW